MDVVKAVLLCPVGFVGGMTGATITGVFEVQNFWDFVIVALVIGAIHQPIVGLLLVLLAKPAWKFLGHSFTTWLFLSVVAYAIGFGCAILLAVMP